VVGTTQFDVVSAPSDVVTTQLVSDANQVSYPTQVAVESAQRCSIHSG
jgi:hypothetical protein